MRDNLLGLEKRVYSDRQTMINVETMMEEIKSGEFKKDIVPNSYIDFSGEVQYHDYAVYKEMLETSFLQNACNLCNNEQEIPYHFIWEE